MTIKYTLLTIQYLKERNKHYLFFTVYYYLIQAIIPLILLWLTRELVNEIVKLIEYYSTYHNVILLLSFQLFIGIFNIVNSTYYRYLEKKTEEKINKDIQHTVLNKSSTVKVPYYDLIEFQQLLSRNRAGVGGRFLTPFTTLMQIVQSVVTLLSLLLFLLSIYWVLALICFFTAIPYFLINTKFGVKRYNLIINQTPIVREVQYLNHLLTDKNSAQEVRLFNLKNMLLSRWKIKYTAKMKEELSIYKKFQIANGSLDSISVLIIVCLTLILALITRPFGLTIGDFVAILQAISTVQNNINRISTYLASFKEEGLYIKDYYNFMNYKDHNIEKYESNYRINNIETFKKSIRFSNVSLKYPNTSMQVLKDISFEIKKGDKIAIVGNNGSGKTSLIRCLINLYPVSNGEILIDDTPINTISTESLNRLFSVTFQDFSKYSFSLKENIVLEEEVDDSNYLLQASLQQSGVDEFIHYLPQKLDTILGRFLKEGTNISGGQWQKVAIARAIYKNSDILIFDEPTSSLDPFAEMEFYKHITDLSKDKTTIFISHKMVAASLADSIIVLQNGEIVETGTHQKLMLNKKQYYEMYTSQANWYINQSKGGG